MKMNWKRYGIALVVLMMTGLGGGMVFGDEEVEEGLPGQIVPDAKPAKPPSILDENSPAKATPTQETVRANRFDLVDSKGKVRAVFAMTPEDEPRLALADRAGKVQAMLSIEPVPGDLDGIPTLRLFDKAGKIRTDIKLTRDGNPLTVLRNKNGGHIASLSGVPVDDGGTEWLLSDENGQIRVALSINHAGTNLTFLDQNRKVRARLGLKPDGTPDFIYTDGAGKERALIETPKAKKAGR
jgi:hypothetical protein